jgi:hypothetical protein
MKNIALKVLGTLAFIAAASATQAGLITTKELVNVSSGGVGIWNFSVGGWTGGGEVTGSFSGEDTNLNTQLNSFTGEITAFTASYSGGSIVSPVSFELADLFGLVYDLDGGPLGDGLILSVEGIGATSGVAQFIIGPGPTGGRVCGRDEDCGAIIGPDAGVPETPAPALILSALLGLFASRLRRKV